MYTKKLLKEKYLAMVDLLHIEYRLKYGNDDDYDSLEDMYNPELIAGYYLFTYGDNALKRWHINTKYKNKLNNIGKEIEKILIEVSTPYIDSIHIEEKLDGKETIELLVWTSLIYGLKEVEYNYVTSINKDEFLKSGIEGIELKPFVYSGDVKRRSKNMHKKEIDVITDTFKKCLNVNIYNILKFMLNKKDDYVRLKTSTMTFSYTIDQINSDYN